MASAAGGRLNIAILALGGQGGGVLSDWIQAAARHAGWRAQGTSVPGVAQRTGATIYYVEIMPPAPEAEAAPVFALSPTPGDVDLVVAAELMEAGRALVRGLVTPDRTVLVTSTHRVYAIGEKIALGDGRADSGKVFERAAARARRLVAFDMEAAAAEAGSVISAALFGAVAASGALPFPRSAFEAAIAERGVGAEASRRAFDLAYERAKRPPTRPEVPTVATPPTPTTPQGVALAARIRAGFPASLGPTLLIGAARLFDYQDPRYAALYLDRVARILPAGHDASRLAVAAQVAQGLAVWMSFEDPIRVADLKTRDSRFATVRREIGAADDQIFALVEFMHPRLQEVAETLPAPLGRRVLRSRLVARLAAPLFAKGRRVRTNGLLGFLGLRLLAALRPWRRITLRYQVEEARILGWLALVEAALEVDPALALELACCQELVKGYSDTHARGLRHFELITELARRRLREPGLAGLVRRLRDAALADEEGAALRALLAELSEAA